MSVSEILDELPKLGVSERQLIFDRMMELQQGSPVEISPELQQAIDEADGDSPEQDISIDEAFRRAKSWNTK